MGAFASLLAAILFASLMEYRVHRLMHYSHRFGTRHRDHHRRNEGQGILWEFRDYVLGSCLLFVPPFFISIPVGFAWASGAVLYAAFSAYAHQLQHEAPTRCVWMSMPVHYVHHKYGMWDHNFGLAVDWWDRIFGTYKRMEWLAEEELATAERSPWQLRWW